MSLVAYDNSDESDEEIVSSSPSETIRPNIASNLSVKRQREGVKKITIPSLKEFEDEESPVAPKKPKFQSGSGLFSLLPPPKNTVTLKKPGFVPYVLSSRKETSSLVPLKREMKCRKTETFNPGGLEDENYSEETLCNEESSKENSDSSTIKDFFSLDGLNSDNKLDNDSCLSSDYGLQTDTLVATFESNNFSQSSSVQLSSDIQQINEPVRNPYFHQPPQSDFANVEQEPLVHKQLDLPVNDGTDLVAESSSKETLLKDKEFLKLQGRRREFESMDIIDVKADDQLTDRNEWLMKSLTEESTHRPSRKKHNMPTQQQKRKHQITYLAFQAKEREMDLKNQWALNSRTRRETQAKYGF